MPSSTANGRYRHGYNRTRLYRIWGAMWTRCRNPNQRSWARYGGRCITVCQEWKDFPIFAEWALANGYEPTKIIDRVDNDRGYTPGNCRFVTQTESSRNRSLNVTLTALGETKCFSAWLTDPRCQVKSHSGLVRRLKRGWTAEKAILTPPMPVHLNLPNKRA